MLRTFGSMGGGSYYASLWGAKQFVNKLVKSKSIGNLEVAMKKCVFAVEKEAKKQITDMHAIKSGNLRSSIRGAISQRGLTFVEGVIDTRKSGTFVKYAIFVHEGHYFRNHMGWVLARPFLRNALNVQKGYIDRQLRLAIFKDFGTVV